MTDFLLDPTIQEPEKLIFDYLHGLKDTNEANLPISGEYITINDNQFKLNVRNTWPSSENLKGVVFFLHGYASQINRIVHKWIAEYFKSQGIAYITFDYPGHGYSTGPQAYFTSPQEIIRPTLDVISLFYELQGYEASKVTTNMNIPKEFNPKKTPFFIMGQSMGGAACAYVSHLVQSYSSLYKGSILLCPAIAMNPPNPILRALMDYIVVPLFGDEPLPEFLSPLKDPTVTWVSDDYYRYTANDNISWPHHIRFITASTLLRLSEEVQDLIPSMRFPFLAIHDPEDKVTKFSGSQMLFDKSQSIDKELLPFPNGRHDLMANYLGTISRKCAEWMLTRANN